MATCKKGHNLIVMFKATAANREEILKYLKDVQDKVILDIINELQLLPSNNREGNIEKIIKHLI